jgi:hypothetical protein
VGSANGYGVQTGQSRSFGNTNFNNNFGNARGGMSIKGDSSIFSSTGFVGGGGSTNVYSSGGQVHQLSQVVASITIMQVLVVPGTLEATLETVLEMGRVETIPLWQVPSLGTI